MSSTTPPSNMRQKSKSNKRAHDDTESSVQRLLNKGRETQSQMNDLLASKDEEDEDDVYFDALKISYKRCLPHNRSYLRFKFRELVYQIECAEYNAQQYGSSSYNQSGNMSASYMPQYGQQQ